MKSTSGSPDGGWRFVTNHARVLECIARDPTARLRDIATAVGITERAIGTIVADLEQSNYLTKVPDGRRNHYVIHSNLPLRHPDHRHRSVRELIEFLRAGDRVEAS